MKKLMFLAIISWLLFMPLKPAPAQFGGTGGVARNVSRLKEPVLIARSDAFLLHSFEGSTFSYSFLPHRAERRVETDLGLSLLHTAWGTGNMRWLYHSGTFAMNTVRISYEQNRLLGIAYDKERLYLCVWSSGSTFTEGDAPPDKEMQPELIRRKLGRFSLITFWAEDGSIVMDTELHPPGDVSELLVKDNVATGPITLVEDGVICFNELIVYEDKKVTKRSTYTNPEK